MHSVPVRIEFADNRRQYVPGEVLTGAYHLDIESAHDLKAVEFSVLWYTEGKGDPDMAVHAFDRREPGQETFIELTQPQPFRTQLPDSPLSYEGLILKVRWCVRVRVFPARGREIVVDRPFHLGAVPAPTWEPV